MNENELNNFLNLKAEEYERPGFIVNDPVSIPHRFSTPQDIEIAGFFAAMLAWGSRQSIINSCNRLLQRMDEAPYDFVMNFETRDLKPMMGFAHRTFNAVDLFHFLDVLKYHFFTKKEPSLQSAFTVHLTHRDKDTEAALRGFYQYFFDSGIFTQAPQRTHKHIATPQKKSACKRLNLFLRWMVRSAKKGVDFGLWTGIKPAQLICPLDVHVARVARHFNLLQRKPNDWQAACELTDSLRKFDAADPVKYDFALFGLGVDGRW